MKNPNGYGSVYKLTGKRRKPFAVAKTIKLSGGKQKRVIIGYYESRKEANMALAEYNRNPFDPETYKTTFYEVYEKMIKQTNEILSEKTLKIKKSLIKTFEPIFDVPIRDIKLVTLQEIIDNETCSHGTISLKKSLCGQVYHYAMKMELVNKNYADLVDINKKKEKVIERKVFTDEEIEKLWKLSGIQEADMILVMIYTGMRIGELTDLKIKDINLKERYCIGGNKTDSGKDRIIPLSNKIMDIIYKYISSDKTYLFETLRGKKIQYNNWREKKFMSLMEEMGVKHTIHDCRHTFATMISKTSASKTSIKKIIGHKNFETTEKIYIHSNLNEFRKVVDEL